MCTSFRHDNISMPQTPFEMNWLMERTSLQEATTETMFPLILSATQLGGSPRSELPWSLISLHPSEGETKRGVGQNRQCISLLT